MSEVSSSALRRLSARLLAPSLPDLFFLALLLAAFTQPQGLWSLLSDGDTGWHIRTGELVLNTGRVPAADPFSFSRPGAPWFAWEWLADVVFAAAWRWRGLAGVAALAGAVLALAATALLTQVLRRGCGLWIGLLAVLAAVDASQLHYLARPHVFSLLFYTLALWALAEDRLRPGGRIWLLVPMTALWVNLHGGFVAWLGTLGLLVMFYAAGREWPEVRRYGVLAACCSTASLLNPYGWQLHLHIARYLNSSWILDHVDEFQSPRIRSEGMIVFALMLLAAVALAARADRFEGLLVLVWGFLALRSARHVPFFAIAAAPLLASAAARYWQRLAGRADKGSPVRVLQQLALELGGRPRLSLWLPVSAAVVLWSAPGALGIGFPETLFPVRAVEGNLPTLAPPASMPRVLTSDRWADYLIYRLYPRQRVFFDGRSDFFGPAIGNDYRRLLSGEGPWRELLDRYRFDIALLPRDWPLSTALDREPGWRVVYRDSLAVLHARDADPPPAAKAEACAAAALPPATKPAVALAVASRGNLPPVAASVFAVRGSLPPAPPRVPPSSAAQLVARTAAPWTNTTNRHAPLPPAAQLAARTAAPWTNTTNRHAPLPPAAQLAARTAAAWTNTTNRHAPPPPAAQLAARTAAPWTNTTNRHAPPPPAPPRAPRTVIAAGQALLAGERP